ncbi:MAG: protoporphyrinogen oxidase [Polyangiaceae bacterium]
MSAPLRIAVVGGGIAGLAAAHAAVRLGRERGQGVQVTLIERSARLGGNLRTESAGGFLFDGPDSWVTSKPHATALARDLGLGSSLIETNPRTRRFYIVWSGRLHPVPEGLVLGVPTRLAPLVLSRLFSLRGKLRMACEPLVPARRFAGEEDESIASFVRRRLGREAAERLAAPLLGGISSGDPEELSIRAAFPQLVAMEREHGSLVRGMRAAARARAAASRGAGASSPAGGGGFLSLSGGLGQLVDALAARLEADGVSVRLGTGVRSLERAGSTWRLDLGDGAPLKADRVALCAPAQVAANLLGSIAAGAARELGTIEHGSTTLAFLGYRAADVSHPLDGVGFVAPREPGRPVVAATWVSSKWAARAPPGHVLLRAFLANEPGALDDDGAVAAARAGLRDLMGIEADPVATRVFRFSRASPMMRVGHLSLVGRVRAELGRAAPGLILAGGGYEGVGIPDCIRQGQESMAALLSLRFDSNGV